MKEVVSFLRNDAYREVLRLSCPEAPPGIDSTLMTGPTEVFKLRWSTNAAATRDLKKMQEAVRHSIDLESFASVGIANRTFYVLSSNWDEPRCHRYIQLVLYF